jgi:hypothetical protein
MPESIEITGGAGPEVTAAIAAVVASIENEERLAAAVRPKPIHQSQWIRTGQSPKHIAPRNPKARRLETQPLEGRQTSDTS